MKLNRTLIGAAALAGALTVAAGGSAFAAQTPDDTNTTSDTTYVAVGSDTADDIIQALSTSLSDGSGPFISSYRATPPATGTTSITTKSAAVSVNCANFHRPNGSGDGLNALSAAVQGQSYGSATTGGISANMTNCVQIARSSSGSNPSNVTPAGALTYVPYAIDSVSYATIGGSSILKNADLSLLKTIYTKNGVPGTTDCGGIAGKWAPLIPQAGSGTRNFWAQIIGISTANRGTIDTTKLATTPADPTAWGSCVRDTVGGLPVQEHDGTVLTAAGSIVPFSTAQFISQGAQVIQDKRGGRTVLNAIDFDNAGGANSVSPFILQQNFKSATTAANDNTRPIYNVVETAKLASDTRLAGLISGPTSTLCSSATAKALIQRFGFDLPPLSGGTVNCGDITKKNT